MPFQEAELANSNIEVGMSLWANSGVLRSSELEEERQPENNAENAVKVTNIVFKMILLGVNYTSCYMQMDILSVIVLNLGHYCNFVLCTLTLLHICWPY